MPELLLFLVVLLLLKLFMQSAMLSGTRQSNTCWTAWQNAKGSRALYPPPLLKSAGY